MKTYDKEEIIKIYFSQYPLYLRLGENIKEATGSFLAEKGIETVSINYRVKKLEQVFQKIERKKYTEPFEQMVDICGVRVICYFQKDIEKIEEIIKKEFEVIEKNNKSDDFSSHKFGYRSKHLVLKIKKDWEKTPNYRNLGDLKFELQIRTALMHAWAEIEHKLAYKRTEQIPKELRRKFFRISALLEEADEQFQEINDKVNKKREDMISILKKRQLTNKKISLDLNSLKTLLDFYFPEKVKDNRNTRDFFNEISKSEITIKELLELYKNKMKK